MEKILLKGHFHGSSTGSEVLFISSHCGADGNILMAKLQSAWPVLLLPDWLGAFGKGVKVADWQMVREIPLPSLGGAEGQFAPLRLLTTLLGPTQSVISILCTGKRGQTRLALALYEDLESAKGIPCACTVSAVWLGVKGLR